MEDPMVPQPNLHEHLNGGRRDRILLQLKNELKKFPSVDTVRFDETRTCFDYEITTTFDCDIFMADTLDLDHATLRANWWTHPDNPDKFKFHYHDSTKYDCGWHRQENDHVEGLDHFQWRTGGNEDYTYEPLELDQGLPPGIVWEIRDRLKSRLSMR